MKKVLLVSLPFGALERPALGLSLLKARLTDRGFPCDIRYLTFPFAEFIGFEDYQWVSFKFPYTAFAGDWTFTAALYGDRADADGRYVQEVLRETWHLDQAAIERLLRIRVLIRPFLDHCLAAVPWADYALVGFTSTFEQNIASLAMAQRVKRAHPDVRIAFGGANWEGEMGIELHGRFPFVDYVCSGEAETSLPALVERVLSGGTADDPAPIPGVVSRVGGRSVYAGDTELVRDLDQLPIPDFDDYFRELGQSTVGPSVIPTLLFETSRGCWWGAKSHCTFCGLNGGTMAFRSKTAERAVRELDQLVERWQVDLVEAVDNIIDMKYFDEMLPALARRRRPVQLFYEVKANLTRRHVEILRQAGVTRIQPGIESLSDHVLRLMRKGVTALRNIQLLKWCRLYGVVPEWNLLYGFPGETREDYAGILSLLPAIRFLQPPTACGPMRLDRFSPYFTTPAAFGLVNVRPMQVYRYLYPFDDASLGRIAYYFDYDYAPGVDPTGFAAEVIDYVEAWRQAPEAGTLSAVGRPDGTLTLVDTRSDAAMATVVLSGLEKAAYEYCDEIRSGAAVAGLLRAQFPDVSFTDQQVVECLDSLVANRLMVADGARYLNLAIPVSAVVQRAQGPGPSRAASGTREMLAEAAMDGLRVP